MPENPVSIGAVQIYIFIPENIVEKRKGGSLAVIGIYKMDIINNCILIMSLKETYVQEHL